LDGGEFDQAALAASACQDRDKVDRFGNERAWNGDDGFLDQLLEPAQSA